MRIVIGGCGFIGSSLRDYFSKSKDQSYCVSRRQSNYEKGIITESELFHKSSDPIIRDSNSLIYLASTTSPRSCDSLEKEVIHNVAVFNRYIEHILSVNPSIRITYLSSGGQYYGTTLGRAAKEEDPASPETPYAVGKKFVEDCIRFHLIKNNLSYAIIRPSNPIGPLQKNFNQGVIPALLRSLASSTPFKVVGSLDSARDYLDTHDLCRAVQLAESSKKNGTWNVGSGARTTLRQLISIAEEVTQKKAILYKTRNPTHHEDSIYLDISKIANDLGWKPVISLKTSIGRMFESLQKDQQVRKKNAELT